MNGFDKLKSQVEGQQDTALQAVVDYLLSRTDMEQKYCNEEKSLEEMCKYIQNKARTHAKNGWNFITNEVVYAWAIMYFSFPNSFLKIEKPKPKKPSKSNTKKEDQNKDKVISLEQAKQQIEEKKSVDQISLFGGVAQ